MAATNEQLESNALTATLGKYAHLLEHDKPLAPLTSFGTGGNARFFAPARSASEMEILLRAALQTGIDCFVIGGGSNLLVSDEGYDGLIIKADMRGLRILDGDCIESGAGEDLSALVDFATKQALTGLEFAAGIYGTVGGAVYGNAGAYGGQIGDLVTQLELIDRAGRTKTVGGEYARFGYRDSYLKTTSEVVLQVRLQLKAGQQDTIRARVEEILAVRNAKFPREGGCAGCFFKNIPDPSQPHGKLPAGKLLDAVGAKGMAVGGARVYENHANIIINDGTASSKDIRELADKLKKKVFDKFGIILQEEVIEIGRPQAAGGSVSIGS
ncbi:MAG: UDP-N-acetylmuramate dehydrogenase [bacterium]